MSIPALGPVANVAPTSILDNLEAGPEPSERGDGFAAVLGSAVDTVTAKQATSNELAVQAVTGELENVHDYTIAATEAAVTLEVTAAIRNKAVDAFNEIMRMQA